MFAPDPEVMQVIREWVQKADNDLTTAAHTLKLGQRCPTDTVCFHAQQCVEKLLKALLVNHGRPFPKTHNLGLLVSLLPASVRPDMTLDEQQRLSDYATVTRYPGDYSVITLSEARAAVKVARRVRRQIRKRLPREVLKPR